MFRSMFLALFIGLATVGEAARADVLYVTSFDTSSITRIDTTTGILTSSGQIGTAGFIESAQRGNGDLLVTRLFANSVVTVDPVTLAVKSTFIPNGSGIVTATGIALGQGNNLFVASRDTNQVLRFNSNTGQLLSGAGSSFLNDPGKLTQGPDGNIYATEFNGNRIVEFDGITGNLLGTFATSNVVAGTRDVAFGPDGLVYLAGHGSDNIVRFDALTGDFVDVFASGLNGANGLAFSPSGNLYVAAELEDLVYVLDPTGAKIGSYAVSGPIGLTVAAVPEPASVALLGCLAIGGAAARRLRRKKNSETN